MDLKTYISQARGRQAELARAIGSYPADVYTWAKGDRPVPLHFCAPIDRATEGAVSRRDLRPEDWHIHWPELVTAENPAPQGTEASHAG